MKPCGTIQEQVWYISNRWMITGLTWGNRRTNREWRNNTGVSTQGRKTDKERKQKVKYDTWWQTFTIKQEIAKLKNPNNNSDDSLFVTVFFMGFADTNENIYLTSTADLCLSFICSDNSWNSKLIQKITISYSFYIYFYIIGCTRPCRSAVSSLAETRLHPDPMTCNSTVTLTHPKQRRHVFLLWVQLQRTHSGTQAVFSSAAQQGQRLPHHPVHDLFRDIWQN